MSQKLSEYHTGYRAYSSKVLNEICFNNNSNDFIFDNQVIAQICFKGYEIAEITCPTKYFKDASSINFKSSCIYGVGVLMTSLKFFLAKQLRINIKLFKNK